MPPAASTPIAGTSLAMSDQVPAFFRAAAYSPSAFLTDSAASSTVCPGKRSSRAAVRARSSASSAWARASSPCLISGSRAFR